jgi:hypothetical protein
LSDESWIEHQVDESSEGEHYFEFLASLRVLARSEHLSAEDRLAALSLAIERAVGGNVGEATEWVERVTLGLFRP